MLISEHIGAYCSDLGRMSTAARGDVPQGGGLAGVGTVSAAERFEFLLRGRKPYTWAHTVALSRGAVHRLQNGSFPDPEKLVPACRVENISLSWWVDGIGAPYIVYIAASSYEHAAMARQIFHDEADSVPVLLGNEQSNYLAFVTDAEGATVDGDEYKYRAVSMLGGVGLDADGMRMLLAIPRFEQAMQLIYIDDAGMLERIPTGHMGAHEFLQLFDAAAHPFDATNPNLNYLRVFAARQVKEPAPAKYELLRQIDQLDPNQAEIVSRMVKGLVAD